MLREIAGVLILKVVVSTCKQKSRMMVLQCSIMLYSVHRCRLVTSNGPAQPSSSIPSTSLLHLSTFCYILLHLFAFLFSSTISNLQMPTHLVSNQGIYWRKTGVQHHLPQGHCVSKSVQSLEATILDPQVQIGDQQRPRLAILFHPFYIPSTSFYILLHPAASFCILVLIHHLKPLDANTPGVQPRHLLEENRGPTPSSPGSLRFKICSKLGSNHSRPPNFGWCLVLLRFLLAGQPESIAWKEEKTPCTCECPLWVHNFYFEDKHLIARPSPL